MPQVVKLLVNENKLTDPGLVSKLDAQMRRVADLLIERYDYPKDVDIRFAIGEGLDVNGEKCTTVLAIFTFDIELVITKEE